MPLPQRVPASAGRKSLLDHPRRGVGFRTAPGLLFTAMNPFLAAPAWFAERIKVNSIRCETRAGRRLWIKHRRPSAGITLALANRFFRVAGNPVRALTDLAEWQRWEVECFQQMHGEHFRAFADGPRAVAAEEVPGVSLAQHLDRANLTLAMTAAAARELRRCHTLHSEIFSGNWSHGDPHAGNFLYAAAEDRARLIDFEVMHDPALPALERHADDLLVFLQDVVGRVSAAAWLALATAFLQAYDRPEVVARLVPRLVLPRGIPRLWWAVRTTYLPGAELSRRLELLRDALLPQSVTA
jgi:hypothetical protein